MVKTQDDKEGMLPGNLSQGEKVTWNGLKTKLGLYYPNKFKKNEASKLWFTWSNFRRGNGSLGPLLEAK